MDVPKNFHPRRELNRLRIRLIHNCRSFGSQGAHTALCRTAFTSTEAHGEVSFTFRRKMRERQVTARNVLSPGRLQLSVDPRLWAFQQLIAMARLRPKAPLPHRTPPSAAISQTRARSQPPCTHPHESRSPRPPHHPPPHQNRPCRPRLHSEIRNQDHTLRHGTKSLTSS